jgi:hypothetical protein
MTVSNDTPQRVTLVAVDKPLIETIFPILAKGDRASSI